MSIGIIGEAIIDLLPLEQSGLKPCIGGSPYNVARALARLTIPTHYLSPLSEDHFGDLLLEGLDNEGVKVNQSIRSTLPTSLAVVNISESGQPNYSLYREGIADRDYSESMLLAQLTESINVIHTGSLAIVPDDLEKIKNVLLAAKHKGVFVSLDINMRPNVVAEAHHYIEGVKSLFPLCDLVKASDEDLEFLGLTGDKDALCNQVLTIMDGGIVAMTLGADGALVSNGELTAYHSGFNVSQVVDTVGAGDCFHAGLLSAFYRQGVLRPSNTHHLTMAQLNDALDQACATAALNIMQQGCQPPFAEEVTGFLRNLCAS